MSETSLADLIADSFPAEDPEALEGPVDNLDAVDELEEDTSDSFLDLLDSDDAEEVSEDEGELEDGESEDEPVDGESHVVKVDGEEITVSLEDLKSGYMRDADYRRKTQALAESRKEFEAEIEQYSTVLNQVQQLESAWEEDPVEVLTQFAAQTGNATQAVALTIRNLAANNLLDREFMSLFGITPEVQRAWADEYSNRSQQRTVSKTVSEQEQRLAEAEAEAEVQRAIQQYDEQIDEILEDEGIELTAKQRKQFRTELAKYAYNAEITNLKAAYKAWKYEKEQGKRKVAQKTVERAKAKRGTKAVSRSSSPAGGASAAAPGDLRSVILASMKEAGA
jgi:hypothetical protein